jgi:hypothetical protein
MTEFFRCGTGKLKTRRRVHFDLRPKSIYFLPTRPTASTAKPLLDLTLSPLNFPLLGNAEWLSSPTLLRRDPFCQLDYLRVVDWEVQNEELLQVFCMEEHDHDSSTASPMIANWNEFGLIGEVAVYNLDYHKNIIIHYTMNGWKSKHAVQARYKSSIPVRRIDKFAFSISVPAEASSRLELAIEYRVQGKTYWDSLNGLNYQFLLETTPCVFEEAEVDEQQLDAEEEYAISNVGLISMQSPAMSIPQRSPLKASLSNQRSIYTSRSESLGALEVFGLNGSNSSTDNSFPLGCSWDYALSKMEFISSPSFSRNRLRSQSCRGTTV